MTNVKHKTDVGQGCWIICCKYC